ncbi:GNAT family N-acetyltransferase [Aquibacillus sediminis]|uniref:GNAT family N-acetyltransferase n=1 Tax=Aquibacillus sediminis TaxID=2574734 RepID=UPI00110999BA|nr:GNAT family N-acetyltransferase [Aquibacillus sediminis]
MTPVKIEEVKQSERHQYINFLLLADESEAVVQKYIHDGDMFSIHYENKVAGVMIFTFHSDQVVELKNIALDSRYRGNGLGTFVVTEAFKIYKRRGKRKMVVGTANSSIGNLIFYQKLGFRMVEIKRDFFKAYPEPIIESGIRALDMVMFEKTLTEN